MPEGQPPGGLVSGLAGAMRGGTVRPILTHPSPMLRDSCQPAGYMAGPALAGLAADLLATMYHANGHGLSAPQVGVLRRVFVMDAGWRDGASTPLVMLDPELVSLSDRTETATERCLSIPGVAVEVTRAVEIVLGWYDLDGSYRRAAFDGPAARIAQHEADHLAGRLIVDFL